MLFRSGSGLRGFAGLVSSALQGTSVALDHFGIVDPGIAPSEHFVRVWEHYGITEAAMTKSVLHP